MNTHLSKTSKYGLCQLALWLLFSIPLLAQQTPLSTVYRDQWSILNPAAISNNYLLNKRTMTLSGSWREQWWNVPESPSTQSVNWEWVQEDYNSVWGAHLLHDRTGKIGQTGLYGRYAYRILMGRRVIHAITIGLQAGFVQYRARLSDINFPDPFTQPMGNEVQYRPDIGVGAFYHYDDRYYAGISVPQTFGLQTEFGEGEEPFQIRRVPHFYGVVGGYFDAPWLGNETSFIEPSLWLKYAAGSPINLDVNARCQISELIWAGTGVNVGLGEQLGLALHFEAGVFLGEQIRISDQHIKLGFGFDVPLSHGLGNAFGSSAEVNVVYSWR